MQRLIAGLFSAALLWSGCSASPECKAQVESLRTKIARIDLHVGALSSTFPYERIPSASGHKPRSRIVGETVVAIDGTRVEFHTTTKSADEPLSPWLVTHARNFWGTLVKEMDPEEPLYLVATATTRLAALRSVAVSLRSIAVIRFAVRPEGPLPSEWNPSASYADMFARTFRRISDESSGTAIQREQEFALLAADGCPEAVAVVDRYEMYADERLKRLPDAFEQCNCRGDMQTVAARYAYDILDERKPIRWYPWDDELLDRLGDDATYGDLVRELKAKPLRRNE